LLVSKTRLTCIEDRRSMPVVRQAPELRPLDDLWAAVSAPVVDPLANLSSFAALWLVQFVLLDKVVFRSAPKEHVA
jgi:hypothetical protein